MPFVSLPNTLNDRENYKFFLDSDGEVSVRTSAKGTFRLSGLNVGGKISEVALNSTTWTALPATALTARNALAIQNRSGINIKLNYDNTTVGYVGVEVSSGEERQYDISDTIIIYAKSESATPTIVVEEIA